MRPDPETNNAFLYCLAIAAQRTGVEILFTVAMSNHHHTGIRDVEGRYPEFIEYFHRMFAKVQNALRGRWENFWASEQTSIVQLEDPEDLLDKLIYAITNPLKDGLVDSSEVWPGVNSYDAIMGGHALTARRPAHYFRTNGPLPDEVWFKLSRPQGYEHLTHEAWSQLVLHRVRTVETGVRESLARDRRRPFGPARVATQNWQQRPKSKARRRNLDPNVAARSPKSRCVALERMRLFRRHYSAAREAVLRGFEGVLFPPGTYWFSRFAGASCGCEEAFLALS